MRTKFNTQKLVGILLSFLLIFTASATPSYADTPPVLTGPSDITVDSFSTHIASYTASMPGTWHITQRSCSEDREGGLWLPSFENKMAMSSDGVLTFPNHDVGGASPYYPIYGIRCEVWVFFQWTDSLGVVTNTYVKSSDPVLVHIKRPRIANIYPDVKTALTPSAYLNSMNPAFSPSVFNYTLTVNYTITSLDWYHSLSDEGNLVGAQVAISGPATLTVGASNVYTITVSGGVVGAATYTFTITRLPKTNVSLMNGMVIQALPAGSSVNLSFTKTTTNYTLESVKNTVTSLVFRMGREDQGASVTVGGTPVVAGAYGPSWIDGEVNLSVGVNTIPVVVTSSDGTSQTTYVFTIERLAKPALLSTKIVDEVLDWIPGAIPESNNLSDEIAVAWQSPVAGSKQKDVWVALVSKTGRMNSPVKLTTANSLAGAISGWPNSQLDISAGPAGQWIVTWDNNDKLFARIVHSTTAGLAIKSGQSVEPIQLSQASNIGAAQNSWSPSLQKYFVVWRSISSTASYLAGATISPDGQASAERTITSDLAGNINNFTGSVNDVTASGTGWIAVWSKKSTGSLVVQKITLNGDSTLNLTASEIQIESANAVSPSLVSDANGTLISYLKSWVPTIRLLKADGTLTDAQVLDTGGQRPRLATSGNGYVATWFNSNTAYTSVISVNGVVSPKQLVQNSDNAQTRPTVTYSQSLNKYVIAWQETSGSPWLYSVWINLVGQPSSKLTALTTDSGALSSSFSSDVFSYSMSVASTVSSIVVSPVTEEAAATTLIAGATGLHDGANTITVQVTSSDGALSSTYTITVTRETGVSSNLNSIASNRIPIPDIQQTKKGILNLVLHGTTGEVAKTKITDMSKNLPLVLDGNVVKVGDSKFSGKLKVALEFTFSDGEKAISITDMTVRPNQVELALAKPISSPQLRTNQGLYPNVAEITWQASPNAIGYQVFVDGTKVATTTSERLSYKSVLSPKNIVKVVPLGADDTFGLATVVKVQEAQYPLARAAFSQNSITLSSSLKSLLKKVAAKIKQDGLKTVSLESYAPIGAGRSSKRQISTARANEIKTYLQWRLGGTKVKFILKTGNSSQLSDTQKVEIKAG